ncbi:hypothetical protein J6590_006050 [Homalodisca vitripennis]|nr:hypothetical protein J6590_006050 [Homalodisca vitripennis]
MTTLKSSAMSDDIERMCPSINGTGYYMSDYNSVETEQFSTVYFKVDKISMSNGIKRSGNSKKGSRQCV